MSNIYEKIDSAIKEIRRIQELIVQGLAKPAEKEEAFRLAKEAAGLFTNDIFKRRADKLSRQTVWTKQTKDGFVASDEAESLNDWINLLEEFNERKKIKAEISSEKIHISSIVEGEDQHIIITEKGSGEHTHLILDGGTGEIRVDPKDKTPHDLVKSIQAKLELKTGETVQVTKSELRFVESEKPYADIRLFTTDKDGYFVLEIYNCGDEDLEQFNIQLKWGAPEGKMEKVLNKVYAEDDYLVLAHPTYLNMLKKGERVYAHIPTISIDRKIQAVVSCKGMRNGKKVEKTFDLETKNQY